MREAKIMRQPKRKKTLLEKKLEKKMMHNLELQYDRALVNLVKAEERMNREAARLEKARNKNKLGYVS